MARLLDFKWSVQTHVQTAVSIAEANMQLTLFTACVQNTMPSPPLITLHLLSLVQGGVDDIGTVLSLGTASGAVPELQHHWGVTFPLALGCDSRAAV